MTLQPISSMFQSTVCRDPSCSLQSLVWFVWFGSSGLTLRPDMFFAFHSLSQPLPFCSLGADGTSYLRHTGIPAVLFFKGRALWRKPCDICDIYTRRGTAELVTKPSALGHFSALESSPAAFCVCKENEKTPLLPPAWLLLSRGSRDKKDFPEVQPFIFFWVFLHSFTHLFRKPILNEHPDLPGTTVNKGVAKMRTFTEGGGETDLWAKWMVVIKG